jgi:RNA polymerase sigma-70 factor (ECF subfamily)
VADRDLLADQFEAHRSHLRAVAYRMLGSLSEADDAVQDAWLRLSRADTGSVDNLGGWLTTVTARVCLDRLRSRRARREQSIEEHLPEPIADSRSTVDPEREAELADSVWLALLIVLEALSPAERLAFVLHDMFDVPFEEIGGIIGRSSTAARQLASRARRRVQGRCARPDAQLTRQRRVVDAFLAASRGGDFGALVAVLDPDVVLRADQSAVPVGARRELRGAQVVARGALGAARHSRFARPALIDGAVGVVVATRGHPTIALAFTFENDRIAGIDVIADPVRLQTLEVGVLP